MNICIVGQYPPQIGGVSTYTHNVKCELERLGHNVYVLTYPGDCKREDNVFEANTINIAGLRGLSFILSGYRKLLDIVDRYDIDVIHANFIIPPAFVAALVKRKKDVRIITHVHGSDINILAENKIMKPLIKYTLNKSDDVYFVSKELYKKALTLDVKDLNKKSTVISNTVNTEKFKEDNTLNELREEYKKDLVIFIGNLVKQKGLTYLLEAKSKAKSDYALLIYGEGIEEENLKRQIQENDIKDVHLLGKTYHPEKIIPQADIMVLPSISEGASIIALESMSCQKAFISTDTGNIKDIITNNDNGIIVPPKDSTRLAQEIDRLISDKNLRDKLGKNARQTIIDNYSKLNIPYIKK